MGVTRSASAMTELIRGRNGHCREPPWLTRHFNENYMKIMTNKENTALCISFNLTGDKDLHSLRVFFVLSSWAASLITISNLSCVINMGLLKCVRKPTCKVEMNALNVRIYKYKLIKWNCLTVSQSNAKQLIMMKKLTQNENFFIKCNNNPIYFYKTNVEHLFSPHCNRHTFQTISIHFFKLITTNTSPWWHKLVV